jgi:protein-S-isoprenylcysteine O-methyltransferase Ste14
MLTKDILFGMNILTLVGLIMTGFGLTLQRMARTGLPVSVAVMGVGTVLVLVGLYASGWPH